MPATRPWTTIVAGRTDTIPIFDAPLASRERRQDLASRPVVAAPGQRPPAGPSAYPRNDPPGAATNDPPRRAGPVPPSAAQYRPVPPSAACPCDRLGMHVRARTEADLGGCERIAEQVHGIDSYPVYLETDLRRFLVSSDAHQAWVAEIDGEVVGHVALHRSASDEVMSVASEATGRPIERLAVVARLLVSPAFRRRGIGRVLLDTAADAAVALGLWPVLDVVTRYRGAIDLYDKAGWARAGEVRWHLPDGAPLDELVYIGPRPSPGSERAQVLAGGVANAGAVARMGAHVLRPSNRHSGSVHRFLSALRQAGFEGASVPVGIDDGQERLVYIEGDVPVPPYPAWAQADGTLATVAALLRRFHDAARGVDVGGLTWSKEMADPLGGPIVCHNDVCLENVVFRDGCAAGLIDFDFAAPGRPVYDLAQMARLCVPIDDDLNASRLGWQPADRASRLRLVADAYGLDRDERPGLMAAMGDSIAGGEQFVRRRVEAGDPNFIKMWDEMGGSERFGRRHHWWLARQARFVTALG